MSELSSAAQAIVDAGRAAQSPSAASKAQVQAALDRAIMESSATGSAAAASTAALSSSWQSGIGKVLVLSLVAVTIGIGYFVLRSSDASGTVSDTSPFARVQEHSLVASDESVFAPPTPPGPIEAPVEAAPEAPVEAPVVEAEAEPARRRHHKNAKPQPAQKPTSDETSIADTLLTEQALIGAAQKAIRDGDYARAQTLLANHRREFPQGVLTPERQATSAIASCLAGPLTDGQVVAAAFLAAHPRSPLAGQVRKSCLVD